MCCVTLAPPAGQMNEGKRSSCHHVSLPKINQILKFYQHIQQLQMQNSLQIVIKLKLNTSPKIKTHRYPHTDTHTQKHADTHTHLHSARTDQLYMKQTLFEHSPDFLNYFTVCQNFCVVHFFRKAIKQSHFFIIT